MDICVECVTNVTPNLKKSTQIDREGTKLVFYSTGMHDDKLIDILTIRQNLQKISLFICLMCHRTALFDHNIV